MNILLTGGTGLIGNRLIHQLIDRGYKVRILTRDREVEPPFYSWSKHKVDEKAFENLDGIIHLAGAPLMKSWTKSYKKEILDSRVASAQLLFKKVKELQVNLKFFITASGSSFYGQETSPTIFTETDKVGEDFLAHVCGQWERAALPFQSLGAKVVCVRTPLVLDKNAESYQLMKLPTQYGFGTHLGNGKQWMPWIHLEDLCRVYIEAIENNQLEGAVNAVAPHHVSHQEFMEILAQSFHTKIRLPHIPSALVKLAMGEKACLILEGSRLSNERLNSIHFQYHYPTLQLALKQINT